MNCIGIRVTPQKIFYCVVAEKEDEIAIINVNHVNIPAAYSIPEKLSFVRSTFIDIISEYNVNIAGIRLTEPIAQKINIFRVNVEGVLQELLASSSVKKYFCGPIASITSLLGLKDKKIVKEYIDGEETFYDIEDWTSYSKEQRECIITSIAALNIKEVA